MPEALPASLPDTDTVLVDLSDGVAVVTMHRPEARNALNTELRTALPATLLALDGHDGVRAMILTGTDPAFCAGLDLKEISTQGMGGGESGSDTTGNNLPLV